MPLKSLNDAEHLACNKFIDSLLSQEEEIILKSFCFSLTRDEIEGELIDVLKRFLDEK